MLFGISSTKIVPNFYFYMHAFIGSYNSMKLNWISQIEKYINKWHPSSLTNQYVYYTLSIKVEYLLG